MTDESSKCLWDRSMTNIKKKLLGLVTNFYNWLVTSSVFNKHLKFKYLSNDKICFRASGNSYNCIDRYNLEAMVDTTLKIDIQIGKRSFTWGS